MITNYTFIQIEINLEISWANVLKNGIRNAIFFKIAHAYPPFCLFCVAFEILHFQWYHCAFYLIEWLDGQSLNCVTSS